MLKTMSLGDWLEERHAAAAVHCRDSRERLLKLEKVLCRLSADVLRQAVP